MFSYCGADDGSGNYQRRHAGVSPSAQAHLADITAGRTILVAHYEGA